VGGDRRDDSPRGEYERAA